MAMIFLVSFFFNMMNSIPITPPYPFPYPYKEDMCGTVQIFPQAPFYVTSYDNSTSPPVGLVGTAGHCPGGSYTDEFYSSRCIIGGTAVMGYYPKVFYGFYSYYSHSNEDGGVSRFVYSNTGSKLIDTNYPFGDETCYPSTIIQIHCCYFIFNSADKNGGDMFSSYEGTYFIITNCILINNSAGLNGGSGCFLGVGTTLHIENSSYTNCSAGQYGGGIYITNPIDRSVKEFTVKGKLLLDGDIDGETTGDALYVKFCNFINCSAGRSGGAINFYITTDISGEFNSKIIGCEFIKCECGENGGAINFNEVGSSVNHIIEIINSSFISCKAKFAGGALYLGAQIKEVTISFCYFSDCVSNGDGTEIVERGGGGIFSYVQEKLEIINSQFINCISKSDIYGGQGGGIFSQITQKVIINVCSFEKCYTNGIDKHGGAISFDRITPVECSLEVNGSVFMNCECEGGGYGGSIYTSINSTKIEFSEFRESKAKRGGAIYINEINQFIIKGSFFDNLAREISFGDDIYFNGEVIENTLSNENIKICTNSQLPLSNLHGYFYYSLSTCSSFVSSCEININTVGGKDESSCITSSQSCKTLNYATLHVNCKEVKYSLAYYQYVRGDDSQKFYPVIATMNVTGEDIIWIINGKGGGSSEKSFILSIININAPVFFVNDGASLTCEYVIFLIPANTSQTIHNNACFFEIKDEGNLNLKNCEFNGISKYTPEKFSGHIINTHSGKIKIFDSEVNNITHIENSLIKSVSSDLEIIGSEKEKVLFNEIHGYCVDGNVIYTSSSDCKFINVSFKDCYTEGGNGGVIVLNGDSKFCFVNCSFENYYAISTSECILSSEIKGGKGGAIYLNGKLLNVFCSERIFINTTFSVSGSYNKNDNILGIEIYDDTDYSGSGEKGFTQNYVTNTICETSSFFYSIMLIILFNLPDINLVVY
jgi:hypothetical protein